jgi:dTDP-4-amino-4,6-dideoxygalactose transaminase
MSPIKLISNQISPNFNFKMALGAAGRVFDFGKEEVDFSEFFGTKNYVLTNAARTALGKIIEVLESEGVIKVVAIPAFICAVVATPFLTKGWKVKWIDTDKNGVISVADFMKKMDGVGVLIAPHIFGQPAPISGLAKICRQKNIFLIEDCAHLLNSETFEADAKIFSFGREKVFSCVSGGALLWAEKSKYAKKFKTIKLKNPPFFWTLTHLLQPLILTVSANFWHIGGRFLAAFFSKIKFLPRAVTTNEKAGREDFLQAKMPVRMQKVLRTHFLFKNNKCVQAEEYCTNHSKTIVKAWERLSKQLFPETKVTIPENFFRVILHFTNKNERNKVIIKAEQNGFSFREWEGVPISPTGVDLQKFQYTEGECPNAEKFAQTYLTLPINIRTKLSDVENFERIFKK